MIEARGWEVYNVMKVEDVHDINYALRPFPFDLPGLLPVVVVLD